MIEAQDDVVVLLAVDCRSPRRRCYNKWAPPTTVAGSPAARVCGGGRICDEEIGIDDGGEDATTASDGEGSHQKVRLHYRS